MRSGAERVIAHDTAIAYELAGHAVIGSERVARRAALRNEISALGDDGSDGLVKNVAVTSSW